MTFLSLAAVVVGTGMALSGLPQAIKIFQRKSAKDISPITYIILTLGAVIWIFYGLEINNPAILITNIIGMVTTSIILVGWYLYGRDVKNPVVPLRKQYHFQPSPKGFYAWDIDKLIEKSKTLPVISIKLDQIKELDENFWYQDSATIPTCRSIAEHIHLLNETDLSYPIILSKDGKVMDGMHRVVKAFLLGHKEIKAVQFTENLEPDYVDVSERDLPY